MSNKRLLLGIVLVAIISAAGSWIYASQTLAPKTLEPLIVLLNFIPTGEHIGLYTALDQGFYEKAGLRVTLVRGFGSADSIKKIDQGAAPIGLGDITALIPLRAKGVKVKAVGLIIPSTPYAFFSLRETQITKPKDLEGKTVGEVAGSVNILILPAFAKLAGFDADKVKVLNVSPSLKYPALAEKKFDAIMAFDYDLPLLEEITKGDVNMIRWADHGFETYSIAIVASDNFIKEKPEMVRSFVKATYQGLQYGIEHKEAAVDAILKYNPELKRGIISAQHAVVIKFHYDQFIKAGKRGLQLGFMDIKVMKETRDLLVKYMSIKQIPVEETFTNEFLQ